MLDSVYVSYNVNAIFLSLKNKSAEIIGSMSKVRKNTIKYSDSGSTSSKPPCSATEENNSHEVKQCCRVLDGMFHRSNTETIMMLMKYSLDLSTPWVTQYYPSEKEGQDPQTSGDNRNMYKVWLPTSGSGILDLFSKNGQYNFLEENG